MVKTMVNPVNPHRYSPPVPYNSVFKLTFASSGQHEDLFSLVLNWLMVSNHNSHRLNNDYRYRTEGYPPVQPVVLLFVYAITVQT